MKALFKTWNKDIEANQLNQQEKYDYIRAKAQQLEEDAKRKEKIITVGKSGIIEDRDKVNNTLLLQITYFIFTYIIFIFDNYYF